MSEQNQSVDAPAPAQETEKKSKGPIIGLVVGLIAFVAVGVGIAALLGNIFGGGGKLVCEGEFHSPVDGLTTTSTYTFHISGGSIDGIDWVRTEEPDADSMWDLDSLYEFAQDEFPASLDTTVSRRGNVVAVEANGFSTSEMRHTGIVLTTSGHIDRDLISNFMEDLPIFNFTCN